MTCKMDCMVNGARNDLCALSMTVRNEIMSLFQTVQGQNAMQESRVEAKLLSILQEKFGELQAATLARSMAQGDGLEVQRLQNHVRTLEQRVSELEEAKVAGCGQSGHRRATDALTSLVIWLSS